MEAWREPHTTAREGWWWPMWGEDVGNVHDVGSLSLTADGVPGASAPAARQTETRRAAHRRGRRASIALALSRLEREHVALLMAICELEGPPGAQDTTPRALREVLLLMLREDLRQTQHALHLAASGEYGACEQCRKPFTSRQLELRPTITRCPVCEMRARRASTLD